jgi:hypothetical protein
MRHNRELASHPPIILVHPVDLGVSFLLSGSRLPISRRHRWACALPEPRLSPKHQHHFVRSTAKARERRRRPALTVDAAPGVEIGTLPGRIGRAPEREATLFLQASQTLDTTLSAVWWSRLEKFISATDQSIGRGVWIACTPVHRTPPGCDPCLLACYIVALGKISSGKT